MDEEDKAQALESVERAVEMLGQKAKEHKKGIGALQKLTSRKDCAEVVGERWLDLGGADLSSQFLLQCAWDDERILEYVDLHLQTLCNVARITSLLPRMTGEDLGLAEIVVRVLQSCNHDSIRTHCQLLVGYLSVDPNGAQALLDHRAVATVMEAATIHDEGFISAALPRLIRNPDLALAFCESGGISFLHGVLVFEDESSVASLNGAVAAVGALAGRPDTLGLILQEAEFVPCFVPLLTSKQLNGKGKLHVVKALFAIAQDSRGFVVVCGSVLPVIELIEDDREEMLPAVLAAFELLALLCNARESIDQVDEYGGDAFIDYLLCFLSSTQSVVVESVCGLLHVLSFGTHREKIVAGLEDGCKNPCGDMIQATMDLIVGARERKRRVEGSSSSSASGTFSSSSNRSSTMSSSSSSSRPSSGSSGSGRDFESVKMETIERPSRRPTKESQTARQTARRANVVKEIASTERTYTVSLFLVLQGFAEPMKKRAMTGGRAAEISETDVSTIFGNLEQIYELHKAFLRKLDRRLSESAQARVSDLFSELATSLVQTYKPYFGNYARALALLVERDKKKGFHKFMSELAAKTGKGLSLENYLIMPIQRLPRYVLLLKELDNSTVDVHPEKPEVARAFQQVQDVVEALNRATILLTEPPNSAGGTVSKAKAARAFKSMKRKNGNGRASVTMSSSAPAERSSSRKQSSSSASGSSSRRTMGGGAARSSSAARSVALSDSSSFTLSSSLSDSSNAISLSFLADDVPDRGRTKTQILPSEAREKQKESRMSMIRDRSTTNELSSVLQVDNFFSDHEVPENPMMVEGVLLEIQSKKKQLFRKVIVLRDRIVVMTSNKNANESGLPKVLKTIPLQYVLLEKDDDVPFSFRLFDTRVSGDGTLFTCSSEEELVLWLDTIFETIYSSQ